MEKNIKLIFPNEYNKILYAVRSSSPEEDLSGASFAGNYETYLGIQYDSLEEYILKAFISCLDYRVFKYKLEKKFNVSEIRIAIIIMKQINCDSSGVGFSINPINNDYDEIVITSNFGLGESVVQGIITPDEYIINKITKKIISKKLGNKDKIVKLNKNKNETSILEQDKEKQRQSSLNDEIIIKLVENIIFIENNYKMPIDIEFGVENNILYILQARPITAYNKIPEQLLTKPNEKRQLYFDVTIGVQGFEKPLSTLGASVIKKIAHSLGIKIAGSYNIDNIKESIADGLGGKLFLNFSNLMTKVEKDSIIKQSETVRKISLKENCIIVGRGADYILKESPHLIRIFLYAPLEYRIEKVKEMYNDTYDEAKKHVLNSDKSRASYYEVITNQKWGNRENYDLCLNCEIGTKKAVNIICDYIEKVRRVNKNINN